jgi:hypothetical protein
VTIDSVQHKRHQQLLAEINLKSNVLISLDILPWVRQSLNQEAMIILLGCQTIDSIQLILLQFKLTGINLNDLLIMLDLNIKFFTLVSRHSHN